MNAYVNLSFLYEYINLFFENSKDKNIFFKWFWSYTTRIQF